MNTFNLTLDLNKSRASSPVRLRQGDAQGTTITALVLDHGATADLTGYTAQFVMDLPDGTHYYRKAASIDGNSVSVMADEAQAASVPGRAANAYFQMLQGTMVKASTGSFTVEILPDALADATVPESYDSAIQDAIDALDEAVEQLPATVEDVLADHPEWTTTVQDGSITAPKLATDLARDRERLLYRLDNLLTNALPEGETATATDAARTPMAALALYGRSTQDGTPSPSSPVPIVSVAGNLANMAYTYPYTRTNSGITWTVNADGSIHANGTATGNSWSHETALAPQVYLPAGTYTTYAVAPDGSVATGFRPRVALAGGSVVAYDNGVKTFTVASGTTATVMLVCNTGTVANADIRLALYAGSTAYPYVPYGNAGLWARGRNLWPTVPSTTTAGITIAVAEDGTVTLNGTATSTVNHIATVTIPETGSYVLSGCPSGGGSSTYQLWTFDQSTPADPQITDTGNGGTGTLTAGHQITLRIRVQSGYTCNNVVMRPMLRLASADAAYVPYTESVTLIPLDGHELRSLPDGTRDELTIDERGHAVLTQRVVASTYDGSSDETWVASGVPFIPLGVDAVNGIGLCDHATQSGTAEVGTFNIYKGSSYPSRFYFNIAGSGAMTVEQVREWLAENPTTLLYKLATPVTHDLGTIDPVPLCGPDLTAQAIPSAPFALTYERDLNATLARLESAIADVATS